MVWQDAGMRTLRLKIKPDAYRWLNAAAIEVNQVWNWAAEHSRSRILNGCRPPSGFDLNMVSSGCTKCFRKIGSDTIQLVNQEYASKRRIAARNKLRWRVSHGPRRNLGWVPFKAASLYRKGNSLRFCSKNFRIFERERLNAVKWQQGSFAQDACGDWWLCLPVERQTIESIAPQEAVGIDLGLKTIATTSDGETLEAGRWSYDSADRLANAQRRGHKRQAKRIYRAIARRRQDALHKFSRSIVDRYQTIVIGDVSSSKLVKTRMAKSVLDSGWYALKMQLQYKGQQAGRSVQIVNESYTTRACSSCGVLTGPKGLDMLVVREWTCADCGTAHNRDVNAARNILALRCRASVSGNELKAA